MVNYSYLYVNTFEGKAFLQWLKKYIMDLEDTTSALPGAPRKTFGVDFFHAVQLPTHNKPIPIAQWNVDELPTDRKLRLDIQRLTFDLFVFFFEPQGPLVQVQVYGWNIQDPAFVAAHTRLKIRLEWDFGGSRIPAEQAITPFEFLPSKDKERIEKARRIAHRKKGKLGRPYNATCESEGINPSTFRRWRKKYQVYL